jgi:RHS repeat-associated protein
LGHITQVFEPNSGGSFIYETDYQYDALDNLTRVDQKGNDSNSANWRTRTFTYDSLSRITSAANPESGTAHYCYSTTSPCVTPDSGTTLCSGDPSSPCTRTDARGITTTYAYNDPLNRLRGKSYNDNPQTPSVSITYDETACLGLPSCYNKGRRTSMTDGAGAAQWAYDAMGRTGASQRVTNSLTKTFSYGYNYDGSLASLTYPSGRQITYLPGGAGRPLNAVDSGSGINYVTAAHYSPSGALSALQNGASLSSTFLYNSRLQPCWIYATTGTPLPTNTLCSGTATSGNILDLKYNFSLGTADNGNVTGITNTRDASHHRDQSFTYDSLNRIATAATLDWSQTFTIDIWANLYNVVATGGAPGLSLTAGANNRLSGLGYDVAGDTTNDGLYNYVYNAEGRNCSVGGTTCANGTIYTYDGDGKRVKKSTGTLYWYGGGSDVLLETDLSGGLQNEYIFFGGKRVARRDASGNVFYYFADHLGSSRVVTNATGTVCYEADFYPYGGERAVTTTCSQNYKFTGKERDTETQNDYFGARYYPNNLGRFMSPDSIANDWELRNPQTWNRYAYARNNPLIYVDPDGAAVELICIGVNSDDCKAQREKALKALQEAVRDKEAASRLYIKEVKEGDNTRYFVGIKGAVGDFMKLGDTSHDLANLVQDKQVVEFGLTKQDLSEWGGAVTYDKGEAGNQNVRVLVNPDEADIATERLGATVLGQTRFGGQGGSPPWRIRSMTPEIMIWHEFGHAWGSIHGRTDGKSGLEAAAWENRMRQQVYGPLGPDNAPRRRD